MIISLFYKNYPNKPIAIFSTIDIALLLIVKLTTKPIIKSIKSTNKQKYNYLAKNRANKQVKKIKLINFYFDFQLLLELV